MRRCLILLIVGIAGCVSVPPPEPIFQEYEAEPIIPVEPVPLPKLSPAPTITVDGIEYLAFDIPATNALLRYREAADVNYVIAADAAATINAMQGEINQLVIAGSATERRLERRVEELNQERQQHWRTTWYYRFLIAIGLAVAVIQ